MSDLIREPAASSVKQPELLVFDVNETLSDMGPLGGRFEDVGAPASLAGVWFAGLLRDGFALTVSGVNPTFADLAAEQLRVRLDSVPLDRAIDEAVEHITAGFAALQVHPDVSDGIHALSALGIRLVTLSNGSASIAQQLLAGAGLDGQFERLLSVEQAGVWKPGPAAYRYALAECGVDATAAMLVAVHPWDTDGAQRAGLSSAWINRTGARFPQYFQQPHVEATSLTDLAGRLHRLQSSKP